MEANRREDMARKENELRQKLASFKAINTNGGRFNRSNPFTKTDQSRGPMPSGNASPLTPNSSIPVMKDGRSGTKSPVHSLPILRKSANVENMHNAINTGVYNAAASGSPKPRNGASSSSMNINDGRSQHDGGALEKLLPLLTQTITNLQKSSSSGSQVVALISGILIGAGLGTNSIDSLKLLETLAPDMGALRGITNMGRDNGKISGISSTGSLAGSQEEGEMTSPTNSRSASPFGSKDPNTPSRRPRSTDFFEDTALAEKRRRFSIAGNTNGDIERTEKEKFTNNNNNNNHTGNTDSHSGWAVSPIKQHNKSTSVSGQFIHPDRQGLQHTARSPMSPKPATNLGSPNIHKGNRGPSDFRSPSSDNSPCGIIDSFGNQVSIKELTSVFTQSFVFVPYQDLSLAFKFIYNVDLWTKAQESTLLPARQFVSSTQELAAREAMDRYENTRYMLYVPYVMNNDVFKHRNPGKSHFGIKKATASSMLFINMVSLILAPIAHLDGDLVADAYKFCYKKNLLPVLVEDTLSGTTVQFNDNAADRDKLWGATVWWLEEIANLFFGWAEQGDSHMLNKAKSIITATGRQENQLFSRLKGLQLERLFIFLPLLLEGINKNPKEMSKLRRLSDHLKSQSKFWPNKNKFGGAHFSPKRGV
ncbi:hypothetical protein H4219_003487 [Mycoemilia scoparia]|uniref:Uncharacterized protein n=1 Tax=Mycoemilia scoparia TaxID=417184 RepID=A0A9W8A013_9FUNG|nr:hypothetical protein H4219_003487 [Mycoemilia scoparia]